MNVVALVKGPVIIMNQLKSFYNSTFKHSHSHHIHICFSIIATNQTQFFWITNGVSRNYNTDGLNEFVCLHFSGRIKCKNR